MILKNKKFLLGTLGFLALGGGGVATFLLLTKKDDATTKPVGKAKIDTSQLTKQAFQTSGIQMAGTISLKANVTLPKQVEVKYFVGKTAPTDNKSYKLVAPSTLKNGDVVHIKFFIKKESVLTHEFEANFTNAISIIVSELAKKTISSTLLQKTSFATKGFQTSGTIGLKQNITLPQEVEVKYFKSRTVPSDSSYSKSAPSDLSNGDKVYIKFFIKSKFSQTHQFANDFTSFFAIDVSNLVKNIVNDSLLVANSFEVTGSQGRATVRLKSLINLPQTVEARYFKGANPPSNDSSYEQNAPSDLSNGEKVHIKFFIKNAHLATYQFSSTFANPIVLTIANLKLLVDHSLLQASSFEVTGSQTLGTISFKAGITLPPEIEVRYFKGMSQPTSDSEYTSSAPNDLKNTDKVFIKFFIKTRFISTHRLSESFTNLVELTISMLPKTEIDASALIKSSFEVTGTQTTATMSKKSGPRAPTFPAQVETKYFKGATAPDDDRLYQSQLVTGLSNGEKVFIKFFVKDGFKETHQFPSSGFTNPIEFVVSGLKIAIDDSKLVATSFEVTGTQTTGTIRQKASVPTLPVQIELKYFKGPIAPVDDGDYQNEPLADLSNGEKVFIKFFVKDAFSATHQFRNDFPNPVEFQVSALPKTEIDDSLLIATSFEVTGTQSMATIIKKDGASAPIFPSQVEFKYFRGSVAPAPEEDFLYKNEAPNDLVNGEEIFIKFFVNFRFRDTHQFKDDFSNPVKFQVGGLLKNEIDNSALVANSFEVIGTQTTGAITKKTGASAPAFPRQVEFKYFKGNIAPSDDRQYESQPPADLEIGDKVFIKSFVKDRFSETHEFKRPFLTNPVVEFTTDVIWTEIDTSKINRKAFAFSEEGENKAMQLKSGITIPSQVELKYYAGTAAPRDDQYVATPPNDIQDNDIIYVKLFIKDVFKTSYKFASNFENPIVFQNVLPIYYVENKKNKKDKEDIRSRATIFEDSNGNIWFIGRRTPLQVLVKNASGSYASSWHSDRTSGLTKGSKITNGWNGKIFEDSSGNLWAMGYRSPLQVLVKNADGSYASSWHSSTKSGLTKGSNIVSGSSGRIFEDSDGNLWVMGHKKPLQVLVKNAYGSYASSWHSDTRSGLTKGSNIKSGWNGTIFQDSDGNLWTAGSQTPLQVLRKINGSYASSWDSDTRSGLTKGSNLNTGTYSRIFQDSDGNLWTMGYKKPLQVLAKKSDGDYADSWHSSTTKSGLTKGSIITSGSGGVILQDSLGNLWAMGIKSKLQVLRRTDGSYANSWHNHTKKGLTKGSKIWSASRGTIFEDSNGNLWAMGFKTRLQVLEKKPNGEFKESWHSDTKSGLTKGSNARKGRYGIIFEDSRGNIWMTSHEKPLQIFDIKWQKWVSAPEPSASPSEGSTTNVKKTSGST